MGILIMSKTYYDILEISLDSSGAEIKRAYRKLSIKYHPDKNPDKNSKEKFQEIKEAYETLKDPDLKEKYDKTILPKTKRKKIKKGSDLKITINVTQEDLILERRKRIMTQRKGLCTQCNGTGSFLKKTKKCKFCNGTGLQGLALVMGNRKNCKHCGGSGNLPEGSFCSVCNGSGLYKETIYHEIILNPMSDYYILKGLGNFCYCGKAGDLIVGLNIIKNSSYEIKGRNISGDIKISPAQAILGDKLNLNVFNRQIKIDIPSGTQNKQIFEIENGGITYKNKTGKFIGKIIIHIPEIISDEEKKLYQKILSIERKNLCRTIAI